MDPLRDDELDGLLSRSAPRTTETTGEISSAIDQLAVDARMPHTPPRRRAMSTRLVVGLAAVAVLGGTATAAAATGGLWAEWAPWAETPDAVITYTLPSGAQCEERLGNVGGEDPEAEAAAEEFLRNTDVNSLLSERAIDETIEDIRSEESIYVNPDGSEEPGGYGTEHYNADQEYRNAVDRLTSAAVRKAVADAGIDPTSYTFDGVGSCPGADW